MLQEKEPITINFMESMLSDRNYILCNTVYRGRAICTCGHVFNERYRYECPDCKTTAKVYYTNKNHKPVNIVALIYYAVRDVTEKSFVIKRYDLVYAVDETAGQVQKVLKEHSVLNYNHDAEKIYLNINGKRTKDISKMGKYLYRSITRVIDDELKKVTECSEFYLKTGFKELTNLYPYWNITTLLDYIDYYKNNKNTGIEILLKAGFYDLAKDAFKRKENLKEGTKVKDFIRLPRNIQRKLKEYPCYNKLNELRILEFIHENGGPLTEESYNYLIQHYNAPLLERIKELIANGGYTLKEILNYVERANLYQAIPEDESIILLSDYVNMALRANLPYEKYPDSLKKAHDLMAREFRFVADKMQNEMFCKVVEQYRSLEYSDGKYRIVLPEDTSDVIREGELMRHCVASYINKIVEGKTMVVFLRQVANPKKPFYTIEVQNGKIVQVRGFANAAVSEPDVKRFIKEWAENKNLELPA